MICQFASSGNIKLSRRLVLLLLCGMVHSGVAADGTIVNDILDSTAFNVAMFAIGWAATRRMKCTEPPFVLHWLKALLVPQTERLLADVPAWRSAKAAKSTAGVLDTVDGGDCPVEAPLLLPEDDDARPFLAGLSSLLAQRMCSATDAELPPWRKSCFHNKVASDLQLGDYLDHIHWFFECSSPCLVLALCYLDRALARHAKVALTAETCHGLVLTSLVMALKFHDEDYVPYPNTFYAEIGKVCAEDMNAMEKQFCKILDWQFYVDAEEYGRYLGELLAAAAPTVAAA